MTGLFSGYTFTIRCLLVELKMGYTQYIIKHVFGFIIGAVWANEAWRSNWNWDPKEINLDKLLFTMLTLAFLTDFGKRTIEKGILVILLFYHEISISRIVIPHREWYKNNTKIVV